MKCWIVFFLIVSGLSRVITALPLAEYTDLLVDLELASGLLRHLRESATNLQHLSFLELRRALDSCQEALYGKAVMRAHCGQFKHAVPHFYWFQTAYQLATCNPWTEIIEFKSVKDGPLKMKLLEAQANQELFFREELKLEIERIRLLGQSPFCETVEPKNYKVLRNALYTGVLGGMIKKVEGLIAKKLQEQFGGELLTFEQIKKNFKWNSKYFRDIETLSLALQTFIWIPLMKFTRKIKWYSQGMETKES